MVASIKCAWFILRHKYFVFMAGFKLGVPMSRLFMHDVSKFGLAELPHFGRQFYGRANDPDGFMRAWLRHQNSNDHHWEYWISRSGCESSENSEEILPMTEGAVREMVADWLGASRAYGGKWPKPHSWPWFAETWPSIHRRLHADTRSLIFSVMREAGYGLVLEQTAEQKITDD